MNGNLMGFSLPHHGSPLGTRRGPVPPVGASSISMPAVRWTADHLCLSTGMAAKAMRGQALSKTAAAFLGFNRQEEQGPIEPY
jgi:hypothetical protein